eukprot:3938783-Rhodomonas_salina.2
MQMQMMMMMTTTRTRTRMMTTTTTTAEDRNAGLQPLLPPLSPRSLSSASLAPHLAASQQSSTSLTPHVPLSPSLYARPYPVDPGSNSSHSAVQYSAVSTRHFVGRYSTAFCTSVVHVGYRIPPRGPVLDPEIELRRPAETDHVRGFQARGSGPCLGKLAREKGGTQGGG